MATVSRLPRPNALSDRHTAGSDSRQFNWNAAANAMLAAIILCAEIVALGLAMAWGIVGLLSLSDTMIAAFGAPIVAGALAAGIWLYRAAYAADLQNRAEDSHGFGTTGAAGGRQRPLKSSSPHIPA
jgi:ABC-type branched-subunit amino acid transport system permease subunit